VERENTFTYGSLRWLGLWSIYFIPKTNALYNTTIYWM